MNILSGFKTITFNIVAIAATWITTEYGIELSEDHQTAFATTIIALANIGLRVLTKTPIGKKDRK